MKAVARTTSITKFLTTLTSTFVGIWPARIYYMRLLLASRPTFGADKGTVALL